MYEISQIFFWGGGEIPQEGGEILLKVSPKLNGKFCNNFVSSNFLPKPQH